MAKVFQCDRCKRYDDGVGPNAWAKKPKFSVMISRIGEQESVDYQPTKVIELCDDCSAKVEVFIKQNDVKTA